MPGQQFTYRFVANPAGTLSWHAHHGLERPDGLFGAVIVRPRPGTPSVHADVCDVDNQVMVLAEHYHMDPIDAYNRRVFSGFFPNGRDQKPSAWERMVDGRMAAEVPWVSGLINGAGRYQLSDGSWSPVNLTSFAATPGKTHCFRIVGAMMEKNFRM